MSKERGVIIDTIGEGDASDPTTFDGQRQRDVARELGMSRAEVAARWVAIDLTGTTAIYAGGPYTSPESVCEEQLDRVELALRERGEQLAQMPTVLVFDEEVEGCHAINAGLALAVYLRTSVPPQLIGMQYHSASGNWVMTNRIALRPASVGREALIPIPMGVGPEMLLSELVSTYLIRQKKRMTDTGVGPMGVTLLVALERYRQKRDLGAFAQELGIPGEIVESYRSIHARRHRSAEEGGQANEG